VPSNLIPGADPFGQSFETVRLAIGIGILVLGCVGMIAYLRWKLPRAGGFAPGGSQDAEDSEGQE